MNGITLALAIMTSAFILVFGSSYYMDENSVQVVESNDIHDITWESNQLGGKYIFAKIIK